MGENGNVFVCPQVSSVNVRHTEIFSFVPVDFWPFAFILIYYLYFCTAPDKIIYISISKLITISCSDALPPSELNWCQGGQQKATEGKGLLMAVCILAQCQTRPRLPHLATNRFKLISTTIYLAITLALLSHDTPLSLYCSLSCFYRDRELHLSHAAYLVLVTLDSLQTGGWWTQHRNGWPWTPLQNPWTTSLHDIHWYVIFAQSGKSHKRCSHCLLTALCKFG